MEGMSLVFADAGVATLRYQFPYTEAGGRRPDSPTVLEATVRAAVVRAAEESLPLFAGGKSMGGRMTSQAQAAEPLPGVRGLVFMGFPLHPPKQPSVSRSKHLDRVTIPMLFMQGTRDDLADLVLMREVCASLGSRATLHVVRGRRSLVSRAEAFWARCGRRCRRDSGHGHRLHARYPPEGDSVKHSKGFLAIVNDAKRRIKQTDIAAIWTRITRGDRFHLIDVREDNEWERGHLPGAIHLGKGIVERDIENAIPDPNAEIVLYCGGGFRSALVADVLQRMGYTNVISMDGGYRGWVEAGHPDREAVT
jgi:predicted alpha/beta-hydrolase family hydrolase/rhodanese-related sulfurtransferase